MTNGNSICRNRSALIHTGSTEDKVSTVPTQSQHSPQPIVSPTKARTPPPETPIHSPVQDFPLRRSRRTIKANQRPDITYY